MNTVALLAGFTALALPPVASLHGETTLMRGQRHEAGTGATVTGALPRGRTVSAR